MKRSEHHRDGHALLIVLESEIEEGRCEKQEELTDKT